MDDEKSDLQTSKSSKFLRDYGTKVFHLSQSLLGLFIFFLFFEKFAFFLCAIGWDFLLGSIAAFYVIMVPYTKVEESFNVQVSLLLLLFGGVACAFPCLDSFYLSLIEVCACLGNA